MLVRLGAGLFTRVSAYAFPGSHADPTRIAALGVPGIGFLRARAIARQGLSVALDRRGLRVGAMESELIEDSSKRLRLEVRGPGARDADEVLSGRSRLPQARRVALAGLKPLLSQ